MGGTVSSHTRLAAAIPDLVYDEAATHRRVEGVDQVIETWQGWATAFPDSKGAFDPVCVSGNTVVLEGAWIGTHTGVMDTPDGEIPPTNNSIEIRACQVIQIKDGKVVEMRQYFDMMTMMQQLGLAS